jgi:hypothetical protein
MFALESSSQAIRDSGLNFLENKELQEETGISLGINIFN